MTRALPTKQRIICMEPQGNRIPVGLSPDLKLKKPDANILVFDYGTLDLKVAFLNKNNIETAYVEKIPNFLSEVEAQPRSSSKKRGSSFSERNRRAPKADLTITWKGKTYAIGKQGIKAGGSTNLDGDKTDEEQVILRALFALTLFDLGKEKDEEVHLSIAVQFLSQRDFAQKEKRIRAAIGNSLSWGTSDGARQVKVKSLKVDPEDYHAELLSRLYSADSPNFEDEHRATLGIGFRTFNLGLIDDEGYYDDNNSISFEGKGTSLFYSWVAKDIGLDNWNTAEFIAAVNNGAETFRPQGTDEEIEIGESIELAKGWYLTELYKLIKKNTPSEVERFVITGGGALEHGQRLIKGGDTTEPLWGQAIVCPLADIANSLGQLLELALEL